MEKLRTFIGPSLYDSFVREYAFDDEQCRIALERYRDIYESGRMYDVDIYEGIPELMRSLRDNGMEVFLVTSKPMPFTVKIIERIGLKDIIDHVIAPTLDDNSSDKKRLIEEAVETYGLKKEECIMIGDTKYDICGAVDAGVDSIGVTYGYGSRDELEASGATYIVGDVDSISGVLGIG